MSIDPSLSESLDYFIKNKSRFQTGVKRLKKQRISDLDNWFREAHLEVFMDTDCLKCARCCKGLGPLIQKRDISSMAKALSMKEKDLISRYFQIDEEGDYIFREMPCPFLGTDHYCLIYEDRPDACRRYPHTDQRKMKARWNILLKDCQTCPAVVRILEKVLNKAKSW